MQQIKTLSDLSLEERLNMVREYLTTDLSKLAVWKKYTGQDNEHGKILMLLRKFGFEDKIGEFRNKEFENKLSKRVNTKKDNLDIGNYQYNNTTGYFIDPFVCFECGAPATEDHHIIPRVLGGTKTIPLCTPCHMKVHDVYGRRRTDDMRSNVERGLKKFKEKGGKLGRANENYGKTKTEEEVIENFKTGRIKSGMTRNHNYINSENVKKFCRVLRSVRPEFEACSKEDELFYEDFHKVNIRMTGDDYVEICALWHTFYRDEPLLHVPKAVNFYHRIKTALKKYAENKNISDLE
jgi:hypothetical protein